MTIRSTDESIAFDNSFHVFEVDLVITQVAFALLRIPAETANPCEQGRDIVFSHRGADPAMAVSCIYKRMAVTSRVAAAMLWQIAL
jgi:hypothetical protein